MYVFLDFEASSLAKTSYPIEVGWAGEDGSEETWLIKPAPGWTDWDPGAEALHGVTRERLVEEGAPHGQVARRMLDVLTPHVVYVTAPSWDGHWLSVLLRKAGLPRHALRLHDADEAHLGSVRDILRGKIAGSHLEGEAQRIIRKVRQDFAGRPVRHRALDDAIQERDFWLTVRREAEERALLEPRDQA